MLFSLTSAALACGGMFCSAPALPVFQAGEKIVFAIDSEAGRIEMHTQIAYEGPAQQFSWLVPVPAQPEVFLSTDELFSFLDFNTSPRFRLQRFCSCCAPFDADGGDAFDTDGGDDGGIRVVQHTEVGPYETATLHATSVDLVVAWLREHGYLVPEGVNRFLEPYIASGSYVVALRLQKDRDVGDLEPIGLSWPGDTPSIPLTMTALAATDDMPLIPWILADERAVPENYLHVVLNDLAISWLSGGENYAQVVSRAADQAGGQAFVTDYAGPTRPFADRLASSRRFNVSVLRSTRTTRDLLVRVASQGFVIDNRLLGILDRHLPGAAALAPSVFAGTFDTGGNFYRPTCEDDPELTGCEPVDTGPAVDALNVEIIQPLFRADGLFSRFRYITRLISSASPGEMTVDPRFVLNPDLPRVEQTRTATLRMDDCDSSGQDELTLPDGTTVSMPTGTVGSLVDTFADLPALRIEATGRSGAPTVLVDNTDRIRERLVDEELLAPAPAACGCDGPSAPAAWWLLPAAVLGRRRRAR